MRELNWVYYYSNVEKDQNQYTHEECTRVGPVDAKYVKSSNRDLTTTRSLKHFQDQEMETSF